MFETVPAQVGVFIDEVPRWLGPTMIFFGIEVFLATFIMWNFHQVFSNPPREFRVATWLIILGLLFSTAGFAQIQEITPLFASLLFVLGRMIEGAAVIRFLRKVQTHLSSSGSTSNQSLVERIVGKLVSRLRYRMFTGIVGVVTYTAISYTLLIEPIHQSLQYDIALYWTMMTFTVSIMALSWKLSDIQEELGSPLILGLFLCVGGAEVYNFETFTQIVTVIIGTFGHLSGILLALVFFLLSDSPNNIENTLRG